MMRWHNWIWYLLALAACAVGAGATAPARAGDNPLEGLKNAAQNILTEGTANVGVVAGLPPDLKVASSSDPNDLTGEPVKITGRAELSRLGTNQFSVSCKDFEKFQAAQKGLNWCWAASSQALLQYDSVPNITQDVLAQKFVLGTDMSVQPTVVMRALHPEMEQQLQNKVFLQPSFDKVITTTVVQELSAGHPMIVGLKQATGGHIVVAHAVTYRCTRPAGGPTNASDAILTSLKIGAVAPDSDYELVELAVFDPEQRADEPMTVIKGQDIKNINFMTSRALAKAALDKVIDSTKDDGKHQKSNKKSNSNKGTKGLSKTLKIFGDK